MEAISGRRLDTEPVAKPICRRREAANEPQRVLRALCRLTILPSIVILMIVLGHPCNMEAGQADKSLHVVPDTNSISSEFNTGFPHQPQAHEAGGGQRSPRLLPPEVKMNVLLLLPDHMVDPPPELTSYNWIVVREGALSKGASSDSSRHLHRVFVQAQPVLVVSLGSIDLWSSRGVQTMPYCFHRVWRDFDEVTLLTESAITTLFVATGRGLQRGSEGAMPLISIITSTFRSGDKLQRAYQSLVDQTYNHWEWVLWDDSPDEDTYSELQEMAANDMRLRVFKAPQRSGYIGEMKLRAGSLAFGDWILELDHDDRMPAELLQWVRDIAVTHPATKFIYSDGVELKEEGDEPTSYGDYYGFFHGSYYRQYVRSHAEGPLRQHFVSRAAWLNPLTIRHLVGLPNHVRVWNTAFYREIGGHRKDLSVADDYDLLVRTFLAAQPGEIVCIAAPGYFQYCNSGGNNFTVKRNALIQHLVASLYDMYGEELATQRAVWFSNNRYI